MNSKPQIASPNLTIQETTTLPSHFSVINQILEKINILKREGNTEVRLQLQPESLGHVLIKLQVDNGDLSIHMLTESHYAQSIIQDNLFHFKTNLVIQGLHVESLAVSVGSDPSSFDTPNHRSNANSTMGLSQQKKTSQGSTSGLASIDKKPSWRYGLHAIDYQV
jgi:flagellar hook-length control protein FliK